MSRREEHNSKKLLELRPEMRQKVSSIVLSLEFQGYKPKITCAYRSAAEQKKKFELGYSKTATPGYHNHGLAVDIIDKRWGWIINDDNAKFFLALRKACDDVGVASGGWWFGKRHKDGTKSTADNPTHKSVWNKWGIGWDVVHCQYFNPPAEWREEYKGD